jgi:hypothetical protein
MSRRDVDELFGGKGQPEPRTGLVVGLLVSGLLLAFLGLSCTSVPGALLVLASWNTVEMERDRIETGYLAPDARKRVAALRFLTTAALLVAISLLVVQAAVMCTTDLYAQAWGALIGHLVGTPARAP